jgi:methylase of polypeptide subunit release factors
VSLAPVDRLAKLPDEAALALRDCCRAAGYDDDLIMGLGDVTQGGSPIEARTLSRLLLERRGGPASTLARLFAYSDAVAADEVSYVLGDSLREALHEAGIVRVTEDVVSNFPIRPLEGLWLLCDEATAGSEAVMPPGGTTRQLVTVLPTQIDQTVLDIGCGPGSLALVAVQRGAPSAVGTDVNQRAIEMARFNARLNGHTARTSFLHGDLTEPVSGQMFELVLAQPPYVIQPPDVQAVTYLHGGPTGEEIGLRLVSTLPTVLAPGGTALVLMEAIARQDEALSGRVRRALGEAQMDVLVLAASGPPTAVLVYASAALETAGGGAALPQAMARYIEHVDRVGAGVMHHTLIVIRAHVADRPHERLSATVPVRDIGTGDAHVLERLLAGIDLAALNDKQIGERALRGANRVEWLERRAQPGSNEADAWAVRFGPGTFGRDVDLPRERYAMARALLASPSIEAGVEQFAQAHGQSADDVRGEVLAFVREGLMRGVFQPAD